MLFCPCCRHRQYPPMPTRYILPNATNLCIGSALIKIIISNEIMAFDGSAVFSAMGWAGRTVAGGEARAPRSEQQPKRRATNGWTANTRPFIDERCMEKRKKKQSGNLIGLASSSRSYYRHIVGWCTRVFLAN